MESTANRRTLKKGSIHRRARPNHTANPWPLHRIGPLLTPSPLPSIS